MIIRRGGVKERYLYDSQDNDGKTKGNLGWWNATGILYKAESLDERI
jgi:hypothetical protein